MQKKNNAKQFVIKAASRPLGTKLDMYAAIAGPSAGMTRQDVGDGGARPTGGTKMSAGMGGPGASLGNGSGANPNRQGLSAQNARSSGSIIDPSDKDPSDDPSDRAGWDADKPQTKAPGSDYKPFKYGNAQKDAPGSGVGPQIKAGPIKVKKIVTSPKGQK